MGPQNPLTGVFHVVEPHTRLVSGEPDRSFLLDPRIEPRPGGRCHLVVDVRGLPPEWREPATVGLGQSFDKLAAVLARHR